MEILLIGNFNNKKSRLHILLAEHYPLYKVIDQESIAELTELEAQRDISLIVIILTQNNKDLVEQLLDLKNVHIPVLLVEEEEIAISEEYMNRKNVKGYIRRNAPLERIKSAMNLVLEGGVYKEPTPLAKAASNMKKDKNELIRDWTIISMYSKGFSLEETSEVVEMPLNIVQEQLDEIKKKVFKPAPITSSTVSK